MAQVIECGEEITIRNVPGLNSRLNGDFVSATKILISTTQRWVLRDAEINILLDDGDTASTYSLCSGNKNNAFSVFYDKADGLVKTVRTKTGWWLWLYDIFSWFQPNQRALKDNNVTVMQ